MTYSPAICATCLAPTASASVGIFAADGDGGGFGGDDADGRDNMFDAFKRRNNEDVPGEFE